MTSHRLRELLAGFDPDLPLEAPDTIPAAWYSDADIAQAERERVFARRWCIVGRSEQVAAPGAFLTAEIAGQPILVVRDEDGVLRAFLNVCRHRAAPLLTEPCGTVAKLRCRYHGWTYDLAGRLRGTPEFDGVADFRREDNGLPAVAVADVGAARLGAPRRGRRVAGRAILAPLPSGPRPELGRPGLRRAPRVRPGAATGRCSSITTSTAATTSTRSTRAWPACSTTRSTAPSRRATPACRSAR